jgi:hypothetical protein
MKNSLSSASQMYHIFASSSSKEKDPNMTKLLYHIIITTSAAILSKCTILTPMAVGLRRIGKRILEHPRKREAKELSNKGQTSTISEGARQAEARIHSSLCTACTTVVKSTIT